MKRIPPFVAALALATTSLSAQNIALDEKFASFPPAGWTLVNNNGAASQGWIHDAVNFRAWHEDESGVTADNTLISPAMDLSTFGSAYLHFDGETNYAVYLANHPAGFGDGVSTVEVTTDGGLTWTVIWNDTSLVNGETYAPDINMSTYAGMTGVQLGFHYSGTFAQEWWIGSARVDDSSSPPPPPGTVWAVNLPTTFAAVPFVEDFETAAGVVPTYMALTAIDAATGLADPEAWANIGNLGPCSVPFAGLFNLEMGLIPGSTNYHNVRNAMVLGIDGNNMSGMNVDFQAYDGGEEANDFDKVWVSSDGVEWYDVSNTWNVEIGVDLIWTAIVDMDLTGTPVDTTGNFYLMFGQEDNFPYNDLDGIGIDDINVDGTGVAFNYSVSNLVAGSTATFSVTGGTAFGSMLLVYSLAGSGPTSTPYGPVDLSAPIKSLATLTADVNGDANLSPSVPAGLTGVTLYTQAVDLTAGLLSNSLAEVIG